ncbi:MAG: hypothetical protein ABFC12_01850 [Methanobacterium sp.]
MAHLYLEKGFTYWDSLTYAPFGRPIFYPPLFQYLLAAAGVLFNQDTFTVARDSQPIFAFLVILSFTYTTYKLYNKCTAFFAGFLANIYLLGVDVLSERILTFAVFPLVIMAGLGLDYVRTHFNRKLFYSLAALTVAVAIFFGAYHMSDTEPLVSH